MSSSRSIAAARNRRSGESSIKSVQQRPPPRPSISSQGNLSQGNFSQGNLSQGNFSQGNLSNSRPGQKLGPTNNGPNNGSNGIMPNGLPFTKLSVSDAVGLITLRLGRVEQYIIDTQGEEHVTQSNIPENSKIIDISVLTSIINRIDSLEKKEINSTVQINNLEKEVINLKSMVHVLSNELNTFINNTNAFINNTNEKFIDFENALIEIEKETYVDNHELQTNEENDTTPEIILDNIYNVEVNTEQNTEQNIDDTKENIILVSSEL